MGKKQSGGGRIAAQGRMLVWVTLNPKEKSEARQASGKLDMSLAQFAREATLERARKVNSGKE